MNHIWKRIKRHKNDITIFAVSACVYIGLFLIFWGMMSINNWQLLNISRTAATTIITYILVTIVMRSVYGGFDIGRKKNKPVISSMILASLVTDLISYLQL